MQQKTRFNINRCTVICNLSTMKSLLNKKFKTGHGACADIEKGGGGGWITYKQIKMSII